MRSAAPLLLSLCLFATLGFSSALAQRAVSIGGEVLSPRVETKPLPSGAEGLPAWFLVRLGADVYNHGGELRLAYGGQELHFRSGAWAGRPDLPPAELLGVSLHVPLRVLQELGLRPENGGGALGFARPLRAGRDLSAGVSGLAQATRAPDAGLPLPPVLPEPPPPPIPQLPALAVRDSRSLNRNLESQRLVLDFPPGVTVTHERVAATARELRLSVPGLYAAGEARLPSGDVLTLRPLPESGRTELSFAHRGGKLDILTLTDPPRLVIDSLTNVDPSVPVPPDLAALPAGVEYTQLGSLHLVSFDPLRYRPQVAVAPRGEGRGVAELVAGLGGVAGVNGGYFNTADLLPVDMVMRSGLLLASSLERRSAVGFGEGLNGGVFGVPRPRYFVQTPAGAVVVNAVSARHDPRLLTLHVGDGKALVGGAGSVSLLLGGGAVQGVQHGPFAPPPGLQVLTFDPRQFPQLPTRAGEPLTLELRWQVPGWEGVQDALAAGPRLVAGGRFAVDPVAEGFNTASSVWRRTQQVAYAVLSGRPSFAYFENGTPEEFARALVGAGVSEAIRLDSGGSAALYVGGGWVNPVFARRVPNAIVMVPRGLAANTP